jgi:hypothetical protein
MIGLYNFMQYYEKDLFEKLELPSDVDKEVAIQNILLQCGDKEVLYPESDFMIEAIGMWSKKWQRTFTKWVTVLGIEYNPLENYDRQEAWSDSTSTSESSSASASDSASSSQLGDVSAFNVSDYSPESKATSANNASSTSNASGNKYENSGHRGRIHGNIGVTTSQQMLLAELDVDRFNIYEEIALIFMREFVLAL